MEIKSPKEDENTTDWFDKNKFKKILDIVDSNKVNSSIMTLKTWLIILKIIQLAKEMLKRI